MKRVYLFGAGFFGKLAYQKFNNKLEILGFIDNNPGNVRSEEVWDVPVINGADIGSLDLKEADIIICMRDYDSVAKQLIEAGISCYYVYYDGFLYRNDQTEIMMPTELFDCKYTKDSSCEKNILFVQNTACIRTHKIAAVMKDAGYRVFLLYSVLPPLNQYKDYEKIYDGIFTFTSVEGIFRFINNSEIDVVHCSNEPDILVNIANNTNKPVVADTHDMLSTRDVPTSETMVLEYLANNKCSGNIYTSELVRKLAEKKYGLRNKTVYVLENLVLDQVDIDTLKKKSDLDHEIHCVYEGGVEFYRPELPKYFECIWMKMAEEGIHVHFYSINEEKCKELASKSRYLHYEGNVGGKDLIQELSQYDCGLAMYNITRTNRRLTETYSPNKIYEYLNAGIPVAANVAAHIELLENIKAGGEIDVTAKIRPQLNKITNLDVSKDCLRKNHLTMMSKKEELIRFYENVVTNHDRV